MSVMPVTPVNCSNSTIEPTATTCKQFDTVYSPMVKKRDNHTDLLKVITRPQR